MSKATPRYVLPTLTDVTLPVREFEFPILAEYTRSAACTIVVTHTDLRNALLTALSWCAAYTAGEKKKTGQPLRYFPQITHAGSRVLVKRIETKPYAWIESNTRGEWAPLEALTV